MIRTLTVINYLGESLEIDLEHPEKSGFALTNMSQIGPDESDINIKEVATYDGGVFNSARLNVRNVTLTLRFVGADIETTRQKSYKYFPIMHLVKLVFHTDNRDSYICGYVEENNPDIFANKADKAGCKVSILCADPYFYSVEDLTTVFSGVVPMFEFPFENNDPIEPLIEMGNIVTKQYETVHYTGDIDTGVTIVIHALGTVGNVKIHNVTNRQTMELSSEKLEKLTGSGIVANDTITICSVRGQKSITLLRNGEVYNILNCLGRSINWFKISKGDNIFAYVADDGASNLQFKVISKVLYEGV